MPPGLLGPAEMKTIRATKFHGAARGLERVGVAQEREGPGLNEVLAAVRAGGTRAVPNSIGSPSPHPLFENIIEDMTTVSQEFRLPTGMTIRCSVSRNKSCSSRPSRP
jgi:hypothetical protein